MSTLHKFTLLFTITIGLFTVAAPLAAQKDTKTSDILITVEPVDQGCRETLWLHEKDGTIEVLAKGKERVIAEGKNLWAVRTFEETIKTSNCDCDPEGFEPQDCKESEKAVTNKLTNLQYVNLVDNKIFSPNTHGGDMSGDSIGDYDISVAISGTVGPYVVTVICESNYYCGAAHGDYGCLLQVLDLSGNKTAKILTDQDLLKLDKVEKKKATEGFKKREEVEDPEAGKNSAFFPSYDDKGDLKIQYQFTTWACYACSDGEWDAYSVSEKVDSDFIPGAFTAFAKAPTTVTAYLKKNPGTRITGWSRIEGTPEELKKSLNIFKNSVKQDCHVNKK